MYDIHNPTKSRRIIYDGILNNKEISIFPGKTVSGVELSDDIVEKLMTTKGDLIVTESKITKEFLLRPSVIVESVLHAYYDLRCSPPTYDFVSFLLAAEMARIDGGFDSVNIQVVPGPASGFRSDGLPPFTIPERERMRNNIVLPMTNLLPSCNSAKLMLSRDKPLNNSFGYEQSKYGLKFLVAAAKRNVYPLKYHQIDDTLVDHYITITLRETSYWPTRNSNLDQWILLAKKLGKKVVFVRDTAKANEQIPGFGIDSEASKDVLARARLYAGASLNLFANNGPAWMCLFMGLPCAIFKLTAKNAPCTNDSYLHHHGFNRGDTWPNLRPNQHVSWLSDDNANNMLAEIKRYCGGSLN